MLNGKAANDFCGTISGAGGKTAPKGAYASAGVKQNAGNLLVGVFHFQYFQVGFAKGAGVAGRKVDGLQVTGLVGSDHRLKVGSKAGEKDFLAGLGWARGK